MTHFPSSPSSQTFQSTATQTDEPGRIDIDIAVLILLDGLPLSAGGSEGLAHHHVTQVSGASQSVDLEVAGLQAEGGIAAPVYPPAAIDLDAAGLQAEGGIATPVYPPVASEKRPAAMLDALQGGIPQERSPKRAKGAISPEDSHRNPLASCRLAVGTSWTPAILKAMKNGELLNVAKNRRSTASHKRLVPAIEVNMTCCGVDYSKMQKRFTAHKEEKHGIYLPFECSNDTCDFITRTYHQLCVHDQRMHNQSLNYHCGHCGQSWCIASDVQNHLSQHTAEPERYRSYPPHKVWYSEEEGFLFGLRIHSDSSDAQYVIDLLSKV